MHFGYRRLGESVEYNEYIIVFQLMGQICHRGGDFRENMF